VALLFRRKFQKKTRCKLNKKWRSSWMVGLVTMSYTVDACRGTLTEYVTGHDGPHASQRISIICHCRIFIGRSEADGHMMTRPGGTCLYSVLCYTWAIHATPLSGRSPYRHASYINSRLCSITWPMGADYATLSPEYVNYYAVSPP